ncbi:MAG: malate synthase A [Alphaproteobacteria bacterium]|nr:malate synthase A [Alphaproteobacteria bacterium]
MSDLLFRCSVDGQDKIFTSECNLFLSKLIENFANPIREVLQARQTRQQAFDAGDMPDFDPTTAAIRNQDWQVAPLPADLQDRRLEITGPPSDKKMVINALNANVKCFMADFEDSMSPIWKNVVAGQINLRDAVRGTISYDAPDTGKHYQLNDETALLLCRVRGLHLPEAHITFNGDIVPACLIDFGCYLFHNHQALRDKGTGVYYYIPKLEHYTEARIWANIFAFAENELQLPKSTIRATMLIETFPAVFQMDEILYELRDYAAALNCGRWDYIFSFIKTLGLHKQFLLADRSTLTMNAPFLSAYSRLLIKTCHRRGVLAMGGMAAFIPSRDEAVNKLAMQKVQNDKTLEANNGHDGTWIAHPGLAPIAYDAFNAVLGDNKNQMSITRANDNITTQDLYELPEFNASEASVRDNIKIALQYIEAWLDGDGCRAIYNLMEDAATAEISRSSIWQLAKHQAVLDSGKIMDKATITTLIDEEVLVVKQELGERFNETGFAKARDIFEALIFTDNCPSFLTLPCYDEIVAGD